MLFLTGHNLQNVPMLRGAACIWKPAWIIYIYVADQQMHTDKICFII